METGPIGLRPDAQEPFLALLAETGVGQAAFVALLQGAVGGGALNPRGGHRRALAGGRGADLPAGGDLPVYPTKFHKRTLEATLETCRRWYNACLEERKSAWDERQESVGKYAQLRKVKDHRRGNPFAAQLHSHILQVTTCDLDKAFRAFLRPLKGSEKPGYPRFRGRDRFDSFGLKEYGNGFRLDGRRLKVTGIGRIAVRWHRPVKGEVKTLRIRRQAGVWYACFSCDAQPEFLPSTGAEVGIDVGIASLLSMSDGEHTENPRWYRSEQGRLRIQQHQVARRKVGGANRRRAVRAVACQNAYVANRRMNFLKKLVYDLISRYDRIAVEDLQIPNMARNPHLAKSILDAGWGTFRMHLSFKAAWAGKTVVAVAPAYTSRTCSGCGAVFEPLTLADRWVRCDCGLSKDRDENAALNLLALGRSAWGITWPVAASVPQEAAGL
jgi:putative transposase